MVRAFVVGERRLPAADGVALDNGGTCERAAGSHRPA
jgi:hypothetical protein